MITDDVLRDVGGPSFVKLFHAFAAQNFSVDSGEYISGRVSPGGKVSPLSQRNASPKLPKVVEVLSEAAELKRPGGSSYFTRKWGIHTDAAVLRRAREKQHFVYLHGQPGCGKSALAEAAFGLDLITMVCSSDTEIADLVGGYVPAGDSWAWQDGPLLRAAEEGRPLLLDEIGLADPTALSPLYPFMDGRNQYTVTSNPHRGTVVAKDGFFIVGATNPKAPGFRMSEALLSRFSLHVEMMTDYDLARTLGVPNNIVGAATNLKVKLDNNDVSWAPQMRELLAFRDIEQDFGTEFAIANMVATAPENDRIEVAEVLTKMTGATAYEAQIRN